MTHLQDITFTEKQQNFICTMINMFGDGQHPYADNNTFKYFTTEYVQELLDSDKVLKGLKSRGLEILTEIKALFN